MRVPVLDWRDRLHAVGLRVGLQRVPLLGQSAGQQYEPERRPRFDSAPTPSTHTMHPTPDRVAFESPRGRIVSGSVVDHEVRASTASTTTLLTVDVDGTRFRVPESAVATP
jgi:hypothetical protein